MDGRPVVRRRFGRPAAGRRPRIGGRPLRWSSARRRLAGRRARRARIGPVWRARAGRPLWRWRRGRRPRYRPGCRLRRATRGRTGRWHLRGTRRSTVRQPGSRARRGRPRWSPEPSRYTQGSGFRLATAQIDRDDGFRNSSKRKRANGFEEGKAFNARSALHRVSPSVSSAGRSRSQGMVMLSSPSFGVKVNPDESTSGAVFQSRKFALNDGQPCKSVRVPTSISGSGSSSSVDIQICQSSSRLVKAI